MFRRLPIAIVALTLAFIGQANCARSAPYAPDTPAGGAATADRGAEAPPDITASPTLAARPSPGFGGTSATRLYSPLGQRDVAPPGLTSSDLGSSATGSVLAGDRGGVYEPEASIGLHSQDRLVPILWSSQDSDTAILSAAADPGVFGRRMSGVSAAAASSEKPAASSQPATPSNAGAAVSPAEMQSEAKPRAMSSRSPFILLSVLGLGGIGGLAVLRRIRR